MARGISYVLRLFVGCINASIVTFSEVRQSSCDGEGFGDPSTEAVDTINIAVKIYTSREQPATL